MRRPRVISYYARPASFTTGGVNETRREWADAVAKSGHIVTMVGPHAGYRPANTSDEAINFEEWPHLGSTRSTYLPLGLRRRIAEADLLWLHEGWTLSNVAVARRALRSQVPYFLTPHGVYDPRIVRLQRGAKARAVLERHVLEGAAFVHVFFEQEVEHIARLAPRARTVVAPTGVTPSGRAWRGGGGYLLFLGRIDIHHKGLDLLLQALRRLSRDARPRVRIVGPDHRGDAARLASMIREHNLSAWVTLEPPVAGRAKEELLVCADAVLHPARWESYGRSITEAMSLGAPVMVTTSASITASIPDDAAIKAICSEVGLAEALRKIVTSDLAAVGSRGRDWVETSLHWDRTSGPLVQAVQGLQPKSLT